jgi:hypothetical protein
MQRGLLEYLMKPIDIHKLIGKKKEASPECL